MRSLPFGTAALLLLAGLAGPTAVAGCSGAGTSDSVSGADGSLPPPATSSSGSRDAGADSPPSEVLAPSFCARAGGPLFCADFDGADATGGFTFYVNNPTRAGAQRPTIAATDRLASSPPRSLRAAVPEQELQADANTLVKIGSAPRVTLSFALRPVVGRTYPTIARLGWVGFGGPPRRIDLTRGVDGYELLVEGWSMAGDRVPLTVPIRDDAWATIRLELDLTRGVARLFVDGVPATPEVPGLWRGELEDTLQLTLGLASNGGGADKSMEAAFDDVLVTAP